MQGEHDGPAGTGQLVENLQQVHGSRGIEACNGEREGRRCDGKVAMWHVLGQCCSGFLLWFWKLFISLWERVFFFLSFKN